MLETEYTFEGSLFVEGPATLDEIQTWLKEAVRLDIETEQHGQVSDKCNYSSMLLYWQSLELVEPPDETPWTKNEVPDKAGEYWYYGPRTGNKTPKTYHCRIQVSANNVVVVDLGGSFWFRHELPEGVDFWFAPADPPEPPK